MKKKVGNSMGQEEKYMDEYIKEISEKIEDKKEYYAKISDKIWEYAEPRFQEYKSSELLQQTLKKEGFSIKSNLAGEETAFIAEYGSGKPVIGFLGEFDALPGLSQKADTTEKACWKEKRNKIQIQDILIIVVMAAVISLSEQAPLLPSSH